MHRRAVICAAALPGLLAACASADPEAGLAAQPVHVVFFEDDSVALSDAARAVIRDAAAVARRFPEAPVRVLGFVAPDPGQAPLNALARARAEQVANELASAGVPRGRIRVAGRGAAAFADIPLEGPRVEIRIGTG